MIRFIHHFLRNVLNQECLYHSATFFHWMKCLEILHLDLCRELLFQIMCLYLIFTTHPGVCILIFGLGVVVYYTQTELIYNQHTLHQLIFTIFLTIYFICTIILLIVFIYNVFYLSCNYIWTMSLQ